MHAQERQDGVSFMVHVQGNTISLGLQKESVQGEGQGNRIQDRKADLCLNSVF